MLRYLYRHESLTHVTSLQMVGSSNWLFLCLCLVPFSVRGFDSSDSHWLDLMQILSRKHFHIYRKEEGKVYMQRPRPRGRPVHVVR